MLNQHEHLDQSINSIPQCQNTDCNIFLNNTKQAQNEFQEQDSQSKEQHRLSDILFCSIIIFYLIAVSIFFCALGMSREFRMWIFDFFSDNYQNDIKGLIYVAGVEFILIISGFDIFLIDILFGFFIQPYIKVLFLLFSTKMMGKFICFGIVRYCFQQEIFEAFKGNLVFKILYIAAKSNPIKILIILQLITLPTAFKTYIVGAFSVSTCSFATVSSISNFIWTAFWVHVGVQAKNVKQFIETGKSSVIIPLYVQILIFFGGIAALAYLLKLTNQIYQNLLSEQLNKEKEIK